MITTVLGMLGALLGLILGTAVGSLGGDDRRPNQALALVLLTLSATVFVITGEHGGVFRSSIYPILAEYTLLFLFPPALWFYANTVLGRRPLVPLWVHLIPGAVWLSYLAAFRAGWTSWRWLPPILIMVVYTASYTLAVAFRAWNRRARARTLVSHHTVLRAIVLGLFAVHLSQAVRFLFREVSPFVDIVPLTSTAMLTVLSLLAFRKSRLFAGRELGRRPSKYESSTLSARKVEEIRLRLLETMERDRPFLNENLNLADMVARLKVSRSQLSQVVNDRLGHSFSEFSNRYRVREAKRLLADRALTHLTIEDIGYKAGFRSRSAFHSAFKLATGATPAQARRTLSQKIFEDKSRSGSA